MDPGGGVVLAAGEGVALLLVTGLPCGVVEPPGGCVFTELGEEGVTLGIAGSGFV